MQDDAVSEVRQYDRPNRNRFLAALPAKDFSLLVPHLRTVTLERGATLHEAGDEIEYVYFPCGGMVSLVCVMKNGATVETATVARGGIVGATAGLGSRHGFSTAIVQISGEVARIARPSFLSAAETSSAIRGLVFRYNDLLLSQIQRVRRARARSISSHASRGYRARPVRLPLRGPAPLAISASVGTCDD